MPSADKGIYRAAILEHARNPRNQGRMEAPHRTASASNPLCGDELELGLRLAGETIEEIKWMGRGCTIVQASASMMSEAVSGVPLEQARALGQLFRKTMEQEGEEPPAGLEALAPLTSVRQHRSRIRCALLPWDALDSCTPGE